jgi:signal transduction histidine kinase
MTTFRENTARLLVISVDPVHAAYLRGVLSEGFRVDVVEGDFSPGETNPLGKPDLIVFDVGRGGGTSACRSFLAGGNSGGAPVIVLSDDLQTQVDCLDLGAADCLFRSVHADLLRRKAARLLARKETDQELRRSLKTTREKIKELESIIDMVAHDLRTPVVAIGGFVNLLEKRFKPMLTDPAIREIMRHVSTACDTIQDFLNDLSQSLVADRMELELAPIRMEEAVRQAIDRHNGLIEEKRIELRLHPGGSRHRVLADGRRIGQVLDNLVTNAIRHMGEIPRPIVEIHLEENERTVTVTVSDNGVGVPEEYKDKIFKRFFRIPRRRRQPGSGLGLSIARAIIERHGGKIWLDAEVEQGAVFRFTLPTWIPPGESARPGL